MTGLFLFTVSRLALGTGVLPRGKAAWAWSWPLTSNKCPG